MEVIHQIVFARFFCDEGPGNIFGHRLYFQQNRSESMLLLVLSLEKESNLQIQEESVTTSELLQRVCPT